MMSVDIYPLAVLSFPHEFRGWVSVGLACEGDILVLSNRHGALSGKGV